MCVCKCFIVLSYCIFYIFFEISLVKNVLGNDVFEIRLHIINNRYIIWTVLEVTAIIGIYIERLTRNKETKRYTHISNLQSGHFVAFLSKTPINI